MSLFDTNTMPSLLIDELLTVRKLQFMKHFFILNIFMYNILPSLRNHCDGNTKN